MTLSSDVIQRIKKEIPHGMQSMIAKDLGITRQVVSRVLSGKAKSARVESALIERYLAYKKKVKIINEKIKND